MKGRLNSTLLWRVIVLDAVALFTVLILAYSAGAGAKVPISNVLSLPGNYGLMMLLAFAICASAALVTLFTLDNRVLTPLKQITDFAERYGQGDYRARAAVESADDFEIGRAHV